MNEIFSRIKESGRQVAAVVAAIQRGFNTVSNRLFMSLQYETAAFVKLSPIVVLVLGFWT